MTTALALDISHHTGEVTDEEFRAAKGRGVERIIVGGMFNDSQLNLAQRQMQRANSIGLEVQAYIYLYFRQNVTARARYVLNALPSYVKHVWIDVEDVDNPVPSDVVADTRVVQKMIEDTGRTAGVYTAKWWWDRYMQGSTALSDLPLWDAWWNDEQNMDIRPYGGWTEAVMRQFVGDIHFNTIWCDINIYEVDEGPPVDSTPYSQQQLDAAAALAYQQGHKQGRRDMKDEVMRAILNVPLEG